MSTVKTTGWARRRGAAFVVACVLGGGLAACSHSITPPVGLSDCYESLPLAEGALDEPHDDYVFHGLKLVSPKTMETLVRHRYPHTLPAHLSAAPGKEVCAFAFTGTFAADQVAGAPAHLSGKAAIVLTSTNRKILFSFILAKLPVHFGKTFTVT